MIFVSAKEWSASGTNSSTWLSKSLLRMNERETSFWIAISPASAPDKAVLSAWSATVNTLNGLNAGNWSILIRPEASNCTRALGVGTVEYVRPMYKPNWLEI